MHCLSKRNLYFRELTRGRTGSPEHPSENRRDDIMHVKYKIVFLKGIYTSGNSRAAGLVRPNIHQKIEEMILCM